MFIIKASHSEKTEIKTSLENLQDFLFDLETFVNLMPGVESIHVDSKGIMHWKIQVDIPFVGSYKENFSVEEIESSEERIEWSPAKSEKKNFLSYTVDFMPKGKNQTLMQFAQAVELRRKSATDLHLLAGLAGENLISSEMGRHIAEMVKDFIEKVRKNVE